MKKFIAAILVAMMICSCAFAQCQCVSANQTLKTALLQVINIPDLVVSAEDYETIVDIMFDVDTPCSTAKLAIVHVLMDNSVEIQDSISYEQMRVILEYVCACCCGCKDMKPTNSSPVVPQCNHIGGTHDNGGRCTRCGVYYQTHTITYVSLNNSQHQQVCSCGWTGDTSNHRTTNKVGTENGMNKYICPDCNYTFYWYVSVSNCCDCCGHDCCSGCDCGCM